MARIMNFEDFKKHLLLDECGEDFANGREMAVCACAGEYAPMLFVKWYKDKLRGDGFTDVNELVSILECGPSHPEYGDAWDELIAGTTVIGDNGEEWLIEEDEGGIFLELKG